MTANQPIPIMQRLDEAIAELKELIASRFPEATFDVSEGEAPDGVYLTATVDVEDMGEVVAVFLDRLVDIHVDEELPVYVIPVRPLERNLAILARQRAALAASAGA